MGVSAPLGEEEVMVELGSMMEGYVKGEAMPWAVDC